VVLPVGEKTYEAAFYGHTETSNERQFRAAFENAKRKHLEDTIIDGNLEETVEENHVREEFKKIKIHSEPDATSAAIKKAFQRVSGNLPKGFKTHITKEGKTLIWLAGEK